MICSQSDLAVDCPVCLKSSTRFYCKLRGIDYYCCDFCLAIWKASGFRLKPAEEKVRYSLHQNSPRQMGYLNFLKRLTEPLIPRLSADSVGLDFGCGPGPALQVLLKDHCRALYLYDPCFYSEIIDSRRIDDPGLAVKPPPRQFDFITLTEVVEHFHQPRTEFEKLDSMLKPGGQLAIMTCFRLPELDFSRWHYPRDETHVVFYQSETFIKIAKFLKYECQIPVSNVVLMRKSMTKNNVKKVTAAIIIEQGKVLIARRAAGEKLAGNWEFPGGKMEPGETEAECLKREIAEELDFEIEVESEFARNNHSYPQGMIQLIALVCQRKTFEIKLSVHDRIRWVPVEQLPEVDFSPADIPIALKLANLSLDY